MEISNVNPVTENEMREFFDRIVTNFVSHSAQAQKLPDIQRQLDDLSNRLTSLTQTNDNLKNQIETLVAERDRARKDALDNHNGWITESNDHDGTQKKLQEAQSQLEWANRDNTAMREVLADRDRQNNDLRSQAAGLQQNLSIVGNDVTYYKSMLERSNDTVKARDATITKLQTNLDKIKAIFATVEPLQEGQAESSKPHTDEISF